MQPSEAIILAGGFGTRLKSVVSDLPKPLAPIGERSFLSYLVQQLQQQGLTRLVLSTGYLAEKIRADAQSYPFQGEILFSHEETPLGTGGAAVKALTQIQGESFFLANGDTFFDLDFTAMAQHHFDSGADITLALRPVPDGSRYGSVELDGNRITAFGEKSLQGPALINGGIYLIQRKALEGFHAAESFSIERDFFTTQLQNLYLSGFVSDGYFVDIGEPADFQRAQRELSRYVRRDSTI